MLINLRNALMAGKKLPYDAEVEFLQSSGTQWIDTGVVPNSTTEFELTFAYVEQAGQYNRLLGTQKDGVGKTLTIRSSALNGGSIYFETGSNVGSNIASFDTKIHTISLKSGSLTFDGNAVVSNKYPSDAITSSMWLWGNNDVQYHSKARIYSCKIYQNGTLVRDYIPVRKGAVGYLYDRVSRKLFGNAGTGDFVLGPDVVPVEYIESHGTEWIDTGVIATNSHGFRVDVATAQKTANDNTRIFGVHEGDVRCGFALYGQAETSGNDFFWGWNVATGFVADIPQRFVASLNYKNDRAAIFNGTTNLSSLGTLGNTTKSIYLLNANYNGAPFAGQYVVGRLYKAEISIGSDISNNFTPVRVGTDATSWEGAMMDVLTRKIYRNAGTGAFTYGNDLKYPIPAS